MAEEEVKCDKCGTLNQRDNIYCTSCGNLLRISSGEPITFRDSTPSTEKKKIKLKAYHKIIIFFVVVIIVDLILSTFVMAGFRIPIEGYFAIFGGMFFLSLIVVGIFWGISSSKSVSYSDFEGCGYVIGAIFIVALVIPLFVFTILGAIASAIGSAIAEAIGNAISEAFNNFFSELFEGIEIPGFEPFLFILIFIILSVITAYGYHLRAKRNNK